VVIFSDDPDVTEKLVDKIERPKKRQGLMKRANQLIAMNGLLARCALANIKIHSLSSRRASHRAFCSGAVATPRIALN
jgi:hypothetical protein